MRTFGVVKGQVQRAVVKFHEPPTKQPLAVCFHFPGTFLTHRYVLDNTVAPADHPRDDDDDDDDDDCILVSTCWI